MALLTVSKESALTGAVNSTVTSSLVHGLAWNFDLCACIRHITSHSSLTQLAHQFGACTVSASIWRLHSKRRVVIVSAEFGGKQSRDIGPRCIVKSKMYHKANSDDSTILY